MMQVEPMAFSPLSGKRIAILGSSVAYGWASGGEAVGEYLAARLGAVLTKEAVSGTTLADIDDQSYVSRMRALPPDGGFDLFLCQLSTNDATRGLPLGGIEPGFDARGFDARTITGAIQTIAANARAAWGCPVFFFTGSRFDSDAYAAMVARLYELADKWRFGVLDLWSDDAFNAISEEDRARFMADPIHPKLDGYARWWGPELERQLLEQLPRQ